MLKKKDSIIILAGVAFLINFSAMAASVNDAKQDSPKHYGGHAVNHDSTKTDHQNGHYCPHKMAPADQDKDRKISKDEFIKHHEAIFDKKDINKDGFLDETEMHHKYKHTHESHKRGDHADGDAGK